MDDDDIMWDDIQVDWVEDLTEAVRDAAVREMLARSMGDHTEAMYQRMRHHRLRVARDEEIMWTTDDIQRQHMLAWREKKARKIIKRYKRLVRKGRGLL